MRRGLAPPVQRDESLRPHGARLSPANAAWWRHCRLKRSVTAFIAHLEWHCRKRESIGGSIAKNGNRMRGAGQCAWSRVLSKERDHRRLRWRPSNAPREGKCLGYRLLAATQPLL
jgi:hypothetical protein